MPASRAWRCLLPVLALLALGGCQGYALSVVTARDDGLPGVTFVDEVPEGSVEVVSGVQVTLYRDPGTPNRRVVARGRSDAFGRLALDLEEFGTGWMIEEWDVEVVVPGYETIEQRVTLPGRKSGKTMLVIVARGESRPPRPRDLAEEIESFRR